MDQVTPKPSIFEGLLTNLSLTLSCKNLMDKDIASKSDPVVQMMLLQKHNKWKECGRTEIIQNSQDPEFTETIMVDYRFEQVQRVKFLVWDIDHDNDTFADDDYLGQMECTLGQIVASGIFTSNIVYKSTDKAAGTMTIHVVETAKLDSEVQFSFIGRHLDKKDFLTKSDPFLVISRLAGDVFIPVHRTPHIYNTLNPNWEPFVVTTQKLCNNNYDMKLKITCMDYNENGNHDLIGELYVTLTEMLEGNSAKQWDCINSKKAKKKKKYKNSGTITLQYIGITKISSFLDYVMGGCQMNFTVGIDFTASNGEPKNPNSLHYMNSNQPNEYVKALVAVGEICQDYDSDKRFPVFGFGAKIPPSFKSISYNFPLNFNSSNPYCEGISGIVEAYQKCVRKIQFWGPTNVAPIINQVKNSVEALLIEQSNIASHYNILLLLTDGIISDMNDTIDAIVSASYLPLSLIIVGVGTADFTAMDFLTCNNEKKLRNSEFQEALRDIVQFVPFKDFEDDDIIELARVVLAEVPKQVTEYYKLKNIEPANNNVTNSYYNTSYNMEKESPE